MADCDRPVHARGLCGKHWMRAYRWGRLDTDTYVRNRGLARAATGCDKPATRRGWCAGHRARIYATGDPQL